MITIGIGLCVAAFLLAEILSKWNPFGKGAKIRMFLAFSLIPLLLVGVSIAVFGIFYG